MHKSGVPPTAPALYCHWLWHTITVLCDGTVTCGLDDPFKVRNYGNLHATPLREILDGKAIAARRRALLAGTPCDSCSMSSVLDQTPLADLAASHPYPLRLVLEPSIKCNIRCNNETCNLANDAALTFRRSNFMQWELFCELIDEIAPHLREFYFYNYGEPFLHPRALDMLAYVRKANPRIEVSTSTNGILLARQNKAERIVDENLLDRICFTIGGVNQETYAVSAPGSRDAGFRSHQALACLSRRLLGGSVRGGGTLGRGKPPGVGIVCVDRPSIPRSCHAPQGQSGGAPRAPRLAPREKERAASHDSTPLGGRRRQGR